MHSRSWRQNPVHGPGDVPYVLDPPHSLTVLVTAALGSGWRFGGRFRDTTGNPFTPVDHAVMVDGKVVAVDGALLSERLPGFVQLDLRLDHAWQPSWGTLNLYIDVQNVTDRANPEGVTCNADYAQRSYTTSLPVFPSIGVEYIPRRVVLPPADEARACDRDRARRLHRPEGQAGIADRQRGLQRPRVVLLQVESADERGRQARLRSGEPDGVLVEARHLRPRGAVQAGGAGARTYQVIARLD